MLRGAGCKVVLVGWRGMVPGVQGVWWSWWNGGVWCRGCRVYGGSGGMEEYGAGGAGCRVVLVGWRGMVPGVQGIWWS